MNRWRCYLGLAAAVGLTTAVVSSMSSGTVIAQGNSAAKLNCDIPPCAAVARGRAVFNSRNQVISAETAARVLIATCPQKRFSCRRRPRGRDSMRSSQEEPKTRTRTIRFSGRWTPTTSG